MLKKAQVIMLPTDKNQTESGICLGSKEGFKGKLFKYQHNHHWYNNHWGMTQQHLYILNDDEIEEGVWCIQYHYNKYHYNKYSIVQCDNPDNKSAINYKTDNLWAKKIIATTDTSLNYETPFYGMDADNNFPTPSQLFITEYIEEYNKGNIITEVLVEYERDYTNRNCSTCNLGTDGTCELNLEKKCCSSTNNVTKHGDYWISCLYGEEDSVIYKIKINPKDHSINIKK